MSSKERIKWIDYSKGIGILLVVIAHALAPTNLINIYAYSFHLPLFFLISGLTIREENITGDSYAYVVKKNIKSIIIPYYFYAAFIVIIELIKNILQHDATIDATINIMLRWILMRGLKADWFLPCLFFSKIIFIGIFKLIKNRRNTMIFMPFLALAAMYFPLKLYYLRPIICSCIGAFFVAVGYCFSKIKYKPDYGTKIAIAVTWIVLTLLNGKVSLLVYNFGRNPLLYLLNGVLGSLVIIFAMMEADKAGKNMKILNWFGNNSMIIMVVHMEIMAFLNAILRKVPVIGTNAFLYKTSLICVTIVISVIVTPLVDRIYKSIFGKNKKTIDIAK